MIKKEINDFFTKCTIEPKSKEMTVDDLIELLKEFSKMGYGQRSVRFGANGGTSYYPSPHAYITIYSDTVDLGD